jgi:hypothetical protein
VSWIKEMVSLFRQYRQALRDEKKAMRELRQWMADHRE